VSTVLVTGGCGFIGSHFVRMLVQRTDWRIVNLDKLTYAGHAENVADLPDGPRYRFVRGDIAHLECVDAVLRDERPWGVVNFAAESHVDRSILAPAPFLDTNIGGVHVLLEGARRHGVGRFVQISTDEVYGDAEGREPFGEDSALNPSSPYAATKAAADLLCLAYARTYDFPVVVARSTNNYGPSQFPEKLIPLMVRNALVGGPLPLYGDGLQRREWVYVEDNAEAIFRMLEHGQAGSIYNVSTGEERTNLEVVHAICRILGANAHADVEELRARIRHVADRPGHDRRYALHSGRVRGELDWRPRTPFDAGLEGTVRWYLEHQDWIRRVTSGDYETYYDAVYSRRWGPPA
jgi:dTDP-glucose 4,6-dehydratase